MRINCVTAKRTCFIKAQISYRTLGCLAKQEFMLARPLRPWVWNPLGMDVCPRIFITIHLSSFHRRYIVQLLRKRSNINYKKKKKSLLRLKLCWRIDNSPFDFKLEFQITLNMVLEKMSLIVLSWNVQKLYASQASWFDTWQTQPKHIPWASHLR
jgi:hypothetical protein